MEMGKITDKEYLVLSDMAYKNFEKEDSAGESLLKVMQSPERIDSLLKDPLYSNDKIADPEEQLMWNRFGEDYWNVKKKPFIEEVLNDWKVLAVEDQNKDTTHNGVAFQRKDGKVVFAFRGTEGKDTQEIPKDMIVADGE